LWVSENRVLKEIIWTYEGGSGGSWRRLHKAELHNLYTCIRVIKSRRMRWVENGRDEKYIQNFGWET
jgi:hypothetical protein